MKEPKFVVTFTGDFCDAAGQPKYRDVGAALLREQPRIEQRSFKEHSARILPPQLKEAQAVIVLTPAVTAESVADADDLLLVARFGVGYDAVDVKACTAADVMVTITVGAVDHSVAEATIGWMIALSHNVRPKDALVRNGQWDQRAHHMGRELRERTLGVIGLGGISRKMVHLLRGFEMKPPLAFDPYVRPDTAAEMGVRLVGLEELLQSSDFVSIHCPLTNETRGLIGSRELARMRPDAYLLNTARGGIVDENALHAALKEGRIAGAALDCFAEEPVTAPNRFANLENVLLAPHCIAWTDELFRDIGRSACRAVVDVSLGRRPHGLVNPEVLERPSFQAKWGRLQQHPSQEIS